MNDTVTGLVQSKRKDGKGVKINNNWYSSRNASFFSSVERGATVTLQFTANGQWNNCDENIAPVVSQAAAPSGGGGGGGSNGQFRSPDELIRTDALNSSLKFCEGTLTGTYAENAEKVLKTSELFVAYTKGLVDVNGTSAPAPAQAAPPPPVEEPAPAPAPAAESAQAAPSALSNFLGG